MEKTLRDHYPRRQHVGIQYITIMLTILITTFSMLQIQAADTVRKGHVVSISVQETSIRSAIAILEKKTNYRFFYNHRILSRSGKVNLNLIDAPIENVLSEMLRNSDLDYSIHGEQIVLRKKKTTRGDLFASAQGVGEVERLSLDAYVLSITGTVTSETGDALPGVNVLVKGTNNGTVTDADGKYAINVTDDQSNAVLVFSFIGYVTQEIAIDNRSTIDIAMAPDIKTLSEVVVVGYGTQKKEDLTGAISNTTSKDLERVHSATVSGLLAGKLPGVSFRQTDGRPGNGAMIQVRNMGTPLFIIDGIQKDEGTFNNLAPGDIESISVLKDASAAIYGSRAANGVVIVTTKRGNVGSKPSINVDAYVGWQNWSRFPETVNSYEWNVAKADADVNAYLARNGTGTPTTMTQEELDKWKAGTEKNYRSFDWYDFIIGKNAPQSSFNINASGGSDKTNYYFSVTRFDQDAVLKDYKFYRTNMQANVDTKIGEKFKVGVQINARIETKDNPGIPEADDYWLPRLALFKNRPMERPYANDNPKYPNNLPGHNTTNWAILNKKISGYWRQDWRVMQSNFSGEYELPIKGLVARGMYSYYYADRVVNGHEYKYDVYNYHEPTDTEEAYYEKVIGSSNPYRERIMQKVLENVMQGQLSFNRTFGKHTVGATYVYERIERRDFGTFQHAVPSINDLPLLQFSEMDAQGFNDWDNEEARIGYVGRITYNYADRYYLELNGRRDAAWRFAPGKRWGNFAAVSAGWRISEEAFAKNILDKQNVLTDLKLRTSYGALGDDNINMGIDRNNDPQRRWVEPFDYIYAYRYPSAKVIMDGTVVLGAVENRPVPVTNISWFDSRTFDAGVDFGLWQGKVTGTFDYFYRKRTGLSEIKQDVLLPDELGYKPASENLNSDAQWGHEVSLNYNAKIGEFAFVLGGNISFSRSKNLEVYNDRITIKNSWEKYRNGKVDRFNNISWGYQVVGQFKSFDQIRNHPVNNDNQGNATHLPGDFIYKDVNKDGVINFYDERPIGYGQGGQPMVNYGLSLAVTWRRFDLTADFSGGSGYTFSQNWEMRWPFQGNGTLARFMYEDRWHRKDPLDPNSEWVAGTQPALRYNDPNHVNYNRESDWWVTNVRYLRLRTLELGYSLAPKILEKAKINKARFYVNTYNLFSIDNVHQFGIDPEISDRNGLAYPQNKLVNLGVSLSF